uniref:Uncharacterized protein n=1 Tax=Opuntia streptacantha TaxID=393608 RepID=A0A7C8YRG6_OPUST
MTPQSSPLPVVALRSTNDLFLISSNMKTTPTPPICPYSLKTCLVTSSFWRSSPISTSIWSRTLGPALWAIQNSEFQSVVPKGVIAFTRQSSIFLETKDGSSMGRHIV